MNYTSCIIQILEVPKIKFCQNNIVTLKFRIRLPQNKNSIQSSNIIEGILWGDLAYDLVNYYKINDYILVEGFICINNQSIQKFLVLNILKIYPLSFSLKN